MLNLRKQWDKAGVLNTLVYAGVDNSSALKLLKVFNSHEWDILRIQTKYLDKQLKFALMARAVIGRYDEICDASFESFNPNILLHGASFFLDDLIMELEEKNRANPYTRGAGRKIYNNYCGYDLK